MDSKFLPAISRMAQQVKIQHKSPPTMMIVPQPIITLSRLAPPKKTGFASDSSFLNWTQIRFFQTSHFNNSEIDKIVFE